MLEGLLLNVDLLWPSAWLGRSFIIVMGGLFVFAVGRVLYLKRSSKKTIKAVDDIVANQTTASLYENIAEIRDKAKSSSNEAVKNLFHSFTLSFTS